jgi:serine/threonine protein kinase
MKHITKKNIVKNKKKYKTKKSKTKKYKIKKFIKTTFKRSRNNVMNYKGGSKIYKDGEIIEVEDGNPVFKKVFDFSRSDLAEGSKAEFEITSILKNNPDPNIVKYFDINDKYIDMEELVNLSESYDHSELVKQMRRAKKFLQGLGIMYIDWKLDNIGKGKDGNYKLFDFDASGLIDLSSNSWKIEPLHYYSYNEAIKNGYRTPKEIDDWSFENNIENIL